MGIFGDALSAVGGLFGASSANDAAEQYARDQLAAGQATAAAMRFKPVGVTGSPFGTAQYTKDAQGNLTGAGYTPSAFLQGQQGMLQGAAQGMLPQFTGSMAATAPMGQAAQSMFNLGQGYLGTSPQEQAARYMAEQQALLAPAREQGLSELQNKLAAQGRMGISIGGGASGMMATNPEMAAWYNAQRMQDLGLASQATQGGMDYAKFGAGMVGSGGQMLRDMYGTQTASAAPWQTAMSGMQYTDELARQPMEQGMKYGAMIQPGAQAAGQALGQGMLNSAQTMRGVNSYNPWAQALIAGGKVVGGLESAGNPITSMFGGGGMMGDFGNGMRSMSKYSGGIDDAAMAYGGDSGYQWGY